MSKRIELTINEIEEKLVLDLVQKKGFSRAAAFKAGLRELHRKEFLPYMEPKKKTKEGPSDLYDHLTNEEYCTQVKDGVVDGTFCVIKTGGFEERIPLEIIKNY